VHRCRCSSISPVGRLDPERTGSTKYREQLRKLVTLRPFVPGQVSQNMKATMWSSKSRFRRKVTPNFTNHHEAFTTRRTHRSHSPDNLSLSRIHLADFVSFQLQFLGSRYGPHFGPLFTSCLIHNSKAR
jgi:hypothetical protein